MLQRFADRRSSDIWTAQLLTLAIVVFLTRLGEGLFRGAGTNFFVNTLGLSGAQVLWVNGVREIPGLLQMFVAALLCMLPLARRGALSLVLLGVGYGLYATVNSYGALLGMTVVQGIGFHDWGPVHNALGLAMTDRARSGRVLGALASAGSLASILGLGLVALLGAVLPLRAFYVVGGALIVLGAVVVLRLPKGVGDPGAVRVSRLLVRRRYWLYYVLNFFEGSRTQVFGAFGTLVLVKYYGLPVAHVSGLLALSGLLNFLLAPSMGRLIDRVGERRALSASYAAMAVCFVGYATVHNAAFLAGMLVAINVLLTLRIGLHSYVNRLAPPEELSPTLSAGVSVNHVASVTVSFAAGWLLEAVGYEVLCWGAATMLLLSVPFALAMRTEAPPALQPAAAK